MDDTRIEKTGRYTWAITAGEGPDGIVALIDQLANHRWILKDTNDQRISGRTFGTPKEAHAFYRDEIAPGLEQEPEAPRMG